MVTPITPRNFSLQTHIIRSPSPYQANVTVIFQSCDNFMTKQAWSFWNSALKTFFVAEDVFH